MLDILCGCKVIDAGCFWVWGLYGVYKRLDPGSQAGMTQYVVWGCLFWNWVPFSKRLDHVSRGSRRLTRYWAAEVCSAEATELPVWKRPAVSVANGLCHPKALDPGSSVRLPGMTQNITWWTCFLGNLSTISPFHLSTFKDHCYPRSIPISPFHDLLPTDHSGQIQPKGATRVYCLFSVQMAVVSGKLVQFLADVFAAGIVFAEGAFPDVQYPGQQFPGGVRVALSGAQPAQ